MDLNARYRQLPSVEALASGAALCAACPVTALRISAAREALSECRQRIREGDEVERADVDRLARQVLERLWGAGLVRVINGTGVMIHTNLGRSPLTLEAIASAVGYSNLEYDLKTGRRGSRRQHTEGLIQHLFGAPAALVVNNNAAAVVLMLACAGADKEIVISRGELVEIGGSFRLPDVMATAGCRLREVGTTNKTWLRDFIGATGEQTAAWLRVEPSNYYIEGFTHRPGVEALGEAAAAASIPLLVDLGSATPFATPNGVTLKDNVRSIMSAGAKLCCFSGDKLLGGPQAGILVGSAEWVERAARHPLARAFRPDKLCLAALEHTLRAAATGSPEDIPLQRMLNLTRTDLSVRAEAIATAIGPVARVEDCEDKVGGGSNPGDTLPGVAVTLSSATLSATKLAGALRSASPPLIAVIRQDRVCLHLRTIDPADDAAVIQGVREALSGLPR